MARAKVWNDNTHPNAPAFFVQKFRGREWRIPKGQFIEEDYTEAIEFKSEFFAPVIKDFAHKPEGFKMIRVEKIPESGEVVADEFINHFTGEKFASKAEWEASIKAHEGHLHDEAREELDKPRRGRPAKGIL